MAPQGLDRGQVVGPGQQRGPLSVAELAPVLQFQLHTGQIELAPHRHRQTASIIDDIDLAAEATPRPLQSGAAGLTPALHRPPH